jgi:hypothetical protein
MKNAEMNVEGNILKGVNELNPIAVRRAPSSC